MTTEAKTQDYEILSRVKVGSEYLFPEPGETLIVPLDDLVGQSLVEQGAAKLVVKRVVKLEAKDEKNQK